MNQELMNVFGTAKEIPTFDRIKISLASPDHHARRKARRALVPRPPAAGRAPENEISIFLPAFDRHARRRR